jgi:hypothetical protein
MSGLLSCVVLIAAVTAAEGAEVRGRVADASGGAVSNVLVRLIPAGESYATFRCLTDLKGEFRIRDLPAGVYTLRAGAHAWRERPIPGLEVRSGELKQLDPIRLELAGCDAPEVICDTFGIEDAEPERIVSRGYLELSPGTGADLDRGKVFRPGQSRSGMDLVLSFGAGSWWLIPVNGALLRTVCSSAKLEAGPLRLDGLGPGAEFCVQTSYRRSSHIFIVDEIRPESTSVRLWHVTRK